MNGVPAVIDLSADEDDDTRRSQPDLKHLRLEPIFKIP